MKRLFVCLFVVFSLMLAPIAHATGANCANDSCHNIVSAQDDHHHEGDLQSGEHAQLDFDSEGNPHNGLGHNHSHHHHGGDYFRAFSGIDLTAPGVSSQSMTFGRDAMLSDYSPGPLLEPPSHA